MKKIVALCVSSIFVLGLGVANGEEETPNPWDRMDQKTTTSVKKKKAQKVSKVKNRRTDKKTSAAKAGLKEPEQKKKFIFW